MALDPYRQEHVQTLANNLNERVAAVFADVAPRVKSELGMIKDLAGDDLPRLDPRAQVLVDWLEGEPTPHVSSVSRAPAQPDEFKTAISPLRDKMDDDDLTVLLATYQLQKGASSQMGNIYDRAVELGFPHEYEKSRTILRRWRESDPEIVVPVEIGKRTDNYYAIAGTEHPHSNPEPDPPEQNHELVNAGRFL